MDPNAVDLKLTGRTGFKSAWKSGTTRKIFAYCASTNRTCKAGSYNFGHYQFLTSKAKPT